MKLHPDEQATPAVSMQGRPVTCTHASAQRVPVRLIRGVLLLSKQLRT